MLKKSDLTPLVLDIYAGKICPYCGAGTHSKTEQEVYGKTYKGRLLFCCNNYPKCNSYIGTHDDGTPLGRLASLELRKAKIKAHNVFDAIWQNGYMKREEAYERLSDFLKLDRELTHIGMFGETTCEVVYQWARKLYAELSEKEIKPKLNHGKSK